ncbi:MAG: hypothetical protein IBX64_12585 [Actinobacteria bacterium]|nr:hypothetical protein [Actinomycetota bacterium]
MMNRSVDHKIKESLMKGTEEAVGLREAVHHRILSKIEADSVTRKTKDKNRRRFINLRRVLLIAGIASVMLATPFLLDEFRLPSEESIAQKALAAIEQPGKITYYKISGGLSDDSNPKSRTWQAEYWVDYDKEMLKSIHRSFGGKEEFTAITLIKDGKCINIEKGGNMVDVQESGAPKPFSDVFKDRIARYRELLKSGEAELMGEEEIGGVETYKLKTVLGGPTADGYPTQVEIANIRKDNYQPVKITWDVWEAALGKDSKKIKLESGMMVFEDVRLIDPRELDKGVFDIEIPKDADHQITHNYSIDEAKHFKEFDLYYLGQSFEGFVFESPINYYKVLNVKEFKAMKGLPDSWADLVYINPEDEREEVRDGISISIRPMVEPSVIRSVLVPRGGRTMNVEIDGKPAILWESKPNRHFLHSLFINIGNSTVQITTSGAVGRESKERVIKAAENLKKIN